MAQTATVRFDARTKVFRLDSGGTSYVFGVNPRGELQQLYWGGRLGVKDSFPKAKPAREWASFDSSYTNTPQEYAGWGAGLFNEPALKVSFADGNRDLVLHYLSHTLNGSHVSVLLKDISRDVRVELQYDIDPDSGILARSARIENHTGKSLVVQQAAAATWTVLPGPGAGPTGKILQGWPSTRPATSTLLTRETSSSARSRPAGP